MPIKPLSFKGDKKTKKRKHRDHDSDAPDKAAVADDSAAGDEDSWTTPDTVSDLSGPAIIILPTRPPTCLASDANGNVFASQLENIVEGHAETGEPHDVRQVWVANQVPGTGQISFKGSHGGYLSCDSMGILGARREARGVEEGFSIELIQTDNDRLRWVIQTAATKASEGEAGKRYLSAVTESSSDDPEEKKKVSISLRGDEEAGAATAEMVIKMQARFKPKVQQDKEDKAREKVSRKELEHAVGRKLDEDEVRRLKRARKDGTYHEEILDVRVKGKHDKYA